MKTRLATFAMLAAMNLHAVDHSRRITNGQEYYARAEYRKAAAYFQSRCDRINDAEACYWTANSYERLADIATPYGCRTETKARVYYLKALTLAPDRGLYHDALFDHYLNASDCSRHALRDAAAMLSSIAERTDPNYVNKRMRLENAIRVRGGVENRIADLLLIVPRALYSISELPAQKLPGKPGAAVRSGQAFTASSSKNQN
jgi:hypothetical protein